MKNLTSIILVNRHSSKMWWFGGTLLSESAKLILHIPLMESIGSKLMFFWTLLFHSKNLSFNDSIYFRIFLHIYVYIFYINISLTSILSLNFLLKDRKILFKIIINNWNSFNIIISLIYVKYYFLLPLIC